MITNKQLKAAGIRVPLAGTIEFKQLEKRMRKVLPRRRWAELGKALVKASHVCHGDAFQTGRIKPMGEKVNVSHIGAREPTNIVFRQ